MPNYAGDVHAEAVRITLFPGFICLTSPASPFQYIVKLHGEDSTLGNKASTSRVGNRCPSF